MPEREDFPEDEPELLAAIGERAPEVLDLGGRRLAGGGEVGVQLPVQLGARGAGGLKNGGLHRGQPARHSAAAPLAVGGLPGEPRELAAVLLLAFPVPAIQVPRLALLPRIRTHGETSLVRVGGRERSMAPRRRHRRRCESSIAAPIVSQQVTRVSVILVW
jgi:hypothetical protein